MERYLIEPGSQVHLKDWDPDDTGGFHGGKQEGRERLLHLNGELEVLQERLYAEKKHKVLIVLQAMDSGGKDGTIRNVFDGVNPQGVHVASFKKPTDEELEHDFLWRIHRHAPARGEIVIFNRSHYEDVLIARVHGLVPKDQIEKRYAHINDFERMLHEEGTLILKFFLHISREEQRRRLQDRLDDTGKNWKFNPADIEERKAWDRYMKAYEKAMTETSAEHAPWHVIPANKKWFRNLAVSEILVKHLKALQIQTPEVDFNPKDFIIPD